MQTRRGCTARWKLLNVAGTKRRQAGNRQQLQLFELHLKTVQQQRQQQLWSQKERCKKVKSARIDLGSRRRRGRATNWFCRGSRQQAGRVTEAARRPLPLPFIRCQHQLKQPASERANFSLPLSHSLTLLLSLCVSRYVARYMSSAVL